MKFPAKDQLRLVSDRAGEEAVRYGIPWQIMRAPQGRVGRQAFISDRQKWYRRCIAGSLAASSPYFWRLPGLSHGQLKAILWGRKGFTYF